MDINIYTITEAQRDILINFSCDYIIFRPIQDINNNYFISENEFQLIWSLDTITNELEFFSSLISSIYQPVITQLIR